MIPKDISVFSIERKDKQTNTLYKSLGAFELPLATEESPNELDTSILSKF
jgi:hypothetical protein